MEREERRVCSIYLAWGGRRNLAPKILSYFFRTVLFQILGQDGGMPGWAVAG